MPDELLTIGELAARTGVAASKLRYWEGLGLLPAPLRVSGQRRYPPSAAEPIGVVLLLQDVGFTLREIRDFVATRSSPDDRWREAYQRKLAELDQRIAQAQTARTAIIHALVCPHEATLECPTFAGIVAARLAGASLEEAHQH
ncbi:MerR family transcriptional regulator [Spirillospora sp. NPDC050679]